MEITNRGVRLANARFIPPTKPKTMNKLERTLDAVMHFVTLLAIAGGFYWIFVRFLITYLKTL